MLPRLQSEEKLDAINVAALGSGQVEKQYRMRAIGELQRKALGTRFKPKKASARDLAGMGIGMRVASSSAEETPSSEGSEEGLNHG